MTPKYQLSRRGFLAGSAVTASALLAACSQGEAAPAAQDAPAEETADVAAGVVPCDLDFVPESTPEFAFLKGTWYEMGQQFAQQYPDHLLAAANYATSSAVRQCGSYEAACEHQVPVVELYDSIFSHEKDGKLTDLYRGIADTLGIDFEQAGFIGLPLPGDTYDGPTGSSSAEDEKDCSAILAWGEATASGEPGVIAVMDADTDIQDFMYLPNVVVKPNNGITACCVGGLFGSAVNAAGFCLESPGGSSNLEHVLGTYPHLWTAAYCATVEEAIAFLGDPDGDPESWVPSPSDFNFMMGDATGEALDYQINSLNREIRRCHDKKVLSPTPGDEMPDEAGDYLLTNNLYLTPGMLDNVLSNVRQGIPWYWDDVEPRYWTVDKHLRDAVANGGITLDTLVEAENEIRYYVPEGWNYDYFGDWLFGFWVPSAIYDKLDEEGGITRAEYYGEAYDPSVWGEPMAKEESRQVAAWAPGWHDPSWSGTPEVSTMGYWSPTPVSTVDKNTLRNVFDSNSRSLYITKGSGDRLLSSFADATGTCSVVRFHKPEDGEATDEFCDVVEDMIYDLKKHLWLAARDMEQAGVDIDTPAGKVLEDYVDTGKDCLYQGINHQAQGSCCEDLADRLMHYSHAASVLSKGMCYAQLAQAEPYRIEKDFGSIMEMVDNLAE